MAHQMLLKDFQKFIRSSYLIITVSGRATNIVAVIFLAKVLNAPEFGAFSFLQTTSVTIYTLGTLSLPTSLAVIISRGDRNRTPLENSLILVLFSAAALCCASVALLLIEITARSTLVSVYEWGLFGAYVAMSCLQSLLQSVLFARGQPVSASISLALTSYVLLAGVILVRPASASTALALADLAMLAGIMFAAPTVFRQWLLLDPAVVWSSGASFARRRGLQLLHFSFFSLSSSFVFLAAVWFLQFRLVMVGGAGANAPFALGQQFYNIIIFLPSLFGPVLLRRLSRQEDEARRARDVVVIMLAVTSLCVLGLLAFNVGLPFMLAVMPSRYASAADTLRWAVIAGTIMAVKFPLSVYYQAGLKAVPEAVGSYIAAAVIVAGAFMPFWNENATRSMELRAVGQIVQFACVALCFMTIYFRAKGKFRFLLANKILDLY